MTADLALLVQALPAIFAAALLTVFIAAFWAARR